MDSWKLVEMRVMNKKKKISENTIFTFLMMSTITLLDFGSKETITMENPSLPNKFFRIFTLSTRTRLSLRRTVPSWDVEC